METTIVEAGEYQRVLTVQLAEDDLESAKDEAARKLSRSVSIKGFRPGKAPRKLVEAAVGPEALRKEAIEVALPPIVEDALTKAELAPATVPSIEDMRDTEGGVEVDVKVTLWPRLERPPVFAGRKITVTHPEVTDEELDSQIDRLREQYADLEDVEHPAIEGDFVVIDVAANHAGEPVEEVSSKDLLYEVGSQAFLPGLDENLMGATTGRIASFEAPLPDGFGDKAGLEVEFRILVKGVKKKKLPELTDEWVEEVSEFDSVDSLRDELYAGVAAAKLDSVRAEFRHKVVEELVSEIDLELPDALVGAETEAQIHAFAHRLQQQNISLSDYLQVTGQDQQAFVADARSQAIRSLRTRIALESIIESENLEVTAADLDDAIAEMTAGSDQDADDLRAALEKSEQVDALSNDILRRKAIDLVVEAALPVDADGHELALGPAQSRDEDRVEVPGPESTEDTEEAATDNEKPAEED